MFNDKSGYSLSDIAAVTGTGNRNGDGMFGGDGWWIIVLFLIFANGGWGNGFGGNRGIAQGTTTREEISYGFDMNGLENGIRGIQQGLCDGFYAQNTTALQGFNGLSAQIAASAGDIQNALCQGFNGVNTSLLTGFNGVNNQIAAAAADVQHALCQGFNGLNTSLLTGFNGVNTAMLTGFNGIQAQMANDALVAQQCCCETQNLINSNFANLNYNLATQSCDTRRAIADSTRDIIDSQNSGTRAILDFLTQDKIATLTAENQSLKFAASQANQNLALGAMMDAHTAEIIRRTGNDCPVPAYIVPNPNGCYDYTVTRNTGCGCGLI